MQVIFKAAFYRDFNLQNAFVYLSCPPRLPQPASDLPSLSPLAVINVSQLHGNILSEKELMRCNPRCLRQKRTFNDKGFVWLFVYRIHLYRPQSKLYFVIQLL